MDDPAQFQGRMQRIEELIAAVQEHGNAVVRASAVELVRALLDLHCAGLARMLALVDEQSEAKRSLSDRFVRDDLISRLLLLHGLHPIPLETRDPILPHPPHPTS